MEDLSKLVAEKVSNSSDKLFTQTRSGELLPTLYQDELSHVSPDMLHHLHRGPSVSLH